jgi:hypothetical protein
MRPHDIPHTLTVRIAACELDVQLDEPGHECGAPSEGARGSGRVPAGAGAIGGRLAGRSSPSGRRSPAPRSSTRPADRPIATAMRRSGVASMRAHNEQRSLDDQERELLDVLLNDHPAHLSEAELATALADRIGAEDAIAGLRAYGLIQQADDGFWFLTRVAHYLATLETGPAFMTLDTLLNEPAQLSFRELTADAATFREVSGALDELEDRGALHRSGEDFYWPTRPCRRFAGLRDCGYAATEE